MVAIVSGSGLGLWESLLVGNQGSKTIGQGQVGVTVNATNGNLIVNTRDELIAGLGIDSQIIRTYNSLGQFSDDNGDNTRFSFSQYIHSLAGTINTSGSTVRMVHGDGHESIFTYSVASGVYVSAEGEGAHDTLTYASGVWTYTEGSSQATETFEQNPLNASQWRLKTLQDAEGLGLVFSYNSAGMVSEIHDATNRQIIFVDYELGNNVSQVRVVDTQGTTTEADDTNQVMTTYGYDALGRLTEVRTVLDGSGQLYVTGYSYEGSSKLINSITQADGSVVSFTYTTDGTFRVASVTQGQATDALVTAFVYDDVSQTTHIVTAQNNAGVNLTQFIAKTQAEQLALLTSQSVASMKVVGYDKTSKVLDSFKVVSLPDEHGLQSETEYNFDADGNLISLKDGNGNTTLYQYDTAANGITITKGNLIRQTDANGRVIEQTYTATNQVATRTAYTGVDAVSGQSTGAQTAHYVYGSTIVTDERLRFVISADGAVVETRYSGPNDTRVVSTYHYLDVYGGVEFTESALAAWVAERNAASREDVMLDFRGQVQQTRKFADINDGVWVQSSAIDTHYVYDQHGQLLQTITPYTSVDGQALTATTDYVYDGLGRLLSVVDNSGHTTTTAYNGSQIQTRYTQGLLETRVFNSAGLMVSQLRQELDVNSQILESRTTQYRYDNVGNLRAIISPSGAVNYYLYNEQGLKVADIDATGAITVYQYDAVGNLLEQTGYAKRLTQNVEINALFASLQAQVDSGFTAGGAEELIEAILTTSGFADAANDRTLNYFYDDSGLLEFEINAEGEVTQYHYNHKSELLNRVQHSEILSPEQRAQLTLQALQTILVPEAQLSNVTVNYQNGYVDTESYPTIADQVSMSDPAYYDVVEDKGYALVASGVQQYATGWVASTTVMENSNVNFDKVTLSDSNVIKASFTGSTVKLEKFDATGNLLSTVTNAKSEDTLTVVSVNVTALSGGRSLLQWKAGTGHFAKIVNADGTLGSKVTTATLSSSNVSQESYAVELSNGEILTVSDVATGTLKGTLLNANGTLKQSAVFTLTAKQQFRVTALSAASGGGFVVGWGDGVYLYSQRYTNAGATNGAKLTISSGTSIAATSIKQVYESATGNLTYVWVQKTSSGAYDFRGKTTNLSGALVSQFTLASGLTANAYEVTNNSIDIARLSDNSLAAIYTKDVNNIESLHLLRFSQTGQVLNAEYTLQENISYSGTTITPLVGYRVVSDKLEIYWKDSDFGGAPAVARNLIALPGKALVDASGVFLEGLLPADSSTWSTISHVDVKVNNANGSPLYSTVVNNVKDWPFYQSGQKANLVKVADVASLADGFYDITITRYNTDGSSSVQTLDNYEVGQPFWHDFAVQWPQSVHALPSGGAVNFKYREAGSLQAYQSGVASLVNGQYKVNIDSQSRLGEYDYVIEYLDATGNVEYAFSGDFTLSLGSVSFITNAQSQQGLMYQWSAGVYPADAAGQVLLQYREVGSNSAFTEVLATLVSGQYQVFIPTGLVQNLEYQILYKAANGDVLQQLNGFFTNSLLKSQDFIRLASSVTGIEAPVANYTASVSAGQISSNLSQLQATPNSAFSTWPLGDANLCVKERLNNGDTVLVWNSGFREISYKRFDPNGNLIGDEEKISTERGPKKLSVVSLVDDGFKIEWIDADGSFHYQVITQDNQLSLSGEPPISSFRSLYLSDSTLLANGQSVSMYYKNEAQGDSYIGISFYSATGQYLQSVSDYYMGGVRESEISNNFRLLSASKGAFQGFVLVYSDGNGIRLQRFDLQGNSIGQSITVEGGSQRFVTDVYERSDGKLIVATGAETYSTRIAEIDVVSGAVSSVWDLQESNIEDGSILNMVSDDQAVVVSPGQISGNDNDQLIIRLVSISNQSVLSTYQTQNLQRELDSDTYLLNSFVAADHVELLVQDNGAIRSSIHSFYPAQPGSYLENVLPSSSSELAAITKASVVVKDQNGNVISGPVITAPQGDIFYKAGSAGQLPVSAVRLTRGYALPQGVYDIEVTLYRNGQPDPVMYLNDIAVGKQWNDFIFAWPKNAYTAPEGGSVNFFYRQVGSSGDYLTKSISGNAADYAVNFARDTLLSDYEYYVEYRDQYGYLVNHLSGQFKLDVGTITPAVNASNVPGYLYQFSGDQYAIDTNGSVVIEYRQAGSNDAFSSAVAGRVYDDYQVFMPVGLTNDLEYRLVNVNGAGARLVMFEGVMAARHFTTRYDYAVNQTNQVNIHNALWGDLSTSPVSMYAPEHITQVSLGLESLSVYQNLVCRYRKAGTTDFQTAASQFIDNNGEWVLIGLEEGDYEYQVEFETPNGVSLHQTLTGTFTVSVNGSAAAGSYPIEEIDWNATADRMSRNFYDAGRLEAEMDAEGYITRYSYNALGQLVTMHRYAARCQAFNPVTGLLTDPAMFASSTLSALLAESQEEDKVTHYLYNALGQKTGQIDVAGLYVDELGQVHADRYAYYTAFSYDAAGNLTQTHRYSKAMSQADYLASFTSLFNGHIADSAWVKPQVTTGTDQISMARYDYRGLMIRSTDIHGIETTYQYDDAGRLTDTIVNTQGGFSTVDSRQTSVLYNAFNEVESKQQGEDFVNNKSVTYFYDASGRVAKEVDQKGHVTLFYYNDLGQLTYRINAEKEVTQYEYNAFGEQFKTVAYASRLGDMSGMEGGKITSGLSTLFDQLKTNGVAITEQQFNRNGQVDIVFAARQTENETKQWVADYDFNAFGEQKLLTKAIRLVNGVTQSVTTEYAYDRLGRMTSVREAGANETLAALTRYNLDAFGHVVRSTDANGNHQQFVYDSLGREVKSVDGLGQATVVEYDAFARQLKVARRDAQGVVIGATLYEYNDIAHTLKVTTPEGISTLTTYTAFGQVNSVKLLGAEGQVLQQFQYDKNGRLVVEQSGEDFVRDVQKEYEYDDAGNLEYVIDANDIETRYSYDAVNRLVTVVNDHVDGGLKLTTTYLYDAFGRRITQTMVDNETPAANRVVSTEYDVRGNVTRVRNHTGTDTDLVTDYIYDLSNHVLTDQRGSLQNGVVNYIRTNAYAYDDRGRVKSETVDPEGLAIVTTYDYDKNGNRIRTTDANDNTSHYVYDAANQLRYAYTPVSSTQLAVTEYRYDANGKQVAVIRYATLVAVPATIVAGAGAFDVNAVMVTSNDDQMVQSFYDADSRLVYQVGADGKITHNTYYDNGSLKSVTVWGKTLSELDADVTITESLSRATLTTALLDAVASAHAQTVSGPTEHYIYDKAGRRTHVIDAAGFVTESIYDNVGNIVESRRYHKTVGSESISEADITHFVYDAAGRMTIKVDAENFVTHYSYNDAGELERQIRIAAVYVPEDGNYSAAALNGFIDTHINQPLNRVETWQYDAAGRMTSHCLGDPSGDHIRTNYGYDAQGNPVSITVAADTAKPVTTLYGYDAAGRLTTEISGSETENFSDASADFEASLNRADYIRVRYVYDVMGNRIASIDPRVDQILHSDLAWARAWRLEHGHAEFLSDFPTGSALQALQQEITAAFTTRYGYDVASRQIYQIDPQGYVMASYFNAAGQLTQTIAFANANAGFGKTEYEQAFSVQDSADRVTRYVYNAQHQLAYTIDAEGYVTESGYDYNGFIVKTIRHHEHLNLTVSQLSAESLTSALVSDNQKSQDQVVTIIRNTLGQVAYEVSASGIVKTFTYDHTGNVLDMLTYADRMNLANFSSGITYQDVLAFINVLPEDAEYQKITSCYDALGHLVEQEKGGRSAVTMVTNYGFNAFSEGVDITDVNGSILQKRVQQFDQFGRKVYSQDAEGNVTRNTYDQRGNITSITDAQGNLAYFYYDNLNQLVHEITPTGFLKAYSYDALGNVVQQTVYAGAVNYGSTVNRSEVASVTQANVSIVPSGTASGVYVVASPAKDQITTFTYDTAGRKTSEADAEGNTATYVSNAFDNVIIETDKRGFVTQYEYDNNGQVASRIQTIVKAGPAQGVAAQTVETRYTYDAFGNNTVLIEAFGAPEQRQTIYQYNNENKRVEEIAPDVLTRSWVGKPFFESFTPQFTLSLDTVLDEEDVPDGMYFKLVTDAEMMAYASILRVDYQNRPDLNLGDAGFIIRAVEGKTEIYIQYDQSETFPAALMIKTVTGAYRQLIDFNLSGGGADNDTQPENVNNSDMLVRNVDLCQLRNWSADAVSASLTVAYSRSAQDYVANLNSSDGAFLLVLDEDYNLRRDSSLNELKLYDESGRLIYSSGDIFTLTNDISTPNVVISSTVIQEATYWGGLSLVKTPAIYAYRLYNLNNYVDNLYIVDSEGNRLEFDYDQMPTFDHTIYAVTAYGQFKLANVTWTGPTNEEVPTFDVFVDNYQFNFESGIDGSVRFNIYGDGTGVLEQQEVLAGVNNGQARIYCEEDTWAGKSFKAEVIDLNGNVLQQYTGTFTTNGVRNLQILDLVETALKPTTSQRYDAFGNVVEATDANGNKTYKYFDQFNRVKYQIDGGGYLQSFDYDGVGNIKSHRTYELALAAFSDYAQGLAVVESFLASSPAFREVSYEYDKNNRVIKETKGTVFVYERAESSLSNNGYQGLQAIVTEQSYDALGNITRITTPLGARTNSHKFAYYNAYGKMIWGVNEVGAVEHYVYDANQNQILKVAYATCLDANTLSALSSQGDYQDIEIIEATVRYQVQPGQPQPDFHPDDRIVEYVYDGMNRLVEERVLDVNYSVLSGKLVSEAAGDLVKIYHYDENGNVISITDASGAVQSYAYDGLGRQTLQSSPEYDDAYGVAVKQRTVREYDKLGNVIAETRLGRNDTTDTDDQVIRYTYDKAGNVIRVDYPESRAEVRSYDLAGNVVSETIGQVDYQGKWRGITSEYSYDALNRVETVTKNSMIKQFIHYNAHGEIDSRYNLINGVKDVGSEEYFIYDAVGNLIKTNQDDGIDKVYFYDANGNVTSKIIATINNGELFTDEKGEYIRDLYSLKDFSLSYALMLDPLNQVSREDYVYNAANQLVKTYGFGNNDGSPVVGAIAQTSYVDVLGSYSEAGAISIMPPMSGTVKYSEFWNDRNGSDSLDVAQADGNNEEDDKLYKTTWNVTIDGMNGLGNGAILLRNQAEAHEYPYGSSSFTIDKQFKELAFLDGYPEFIADNIPAFELLKVIEPNGSKVKITDLDGLLQKNAQGYPLLPNVEYITNLSYPRIIKSQSATFNFGDKLYLSNLLRVGNGNIHITLTKGELTYDQPFLQSLKDENNISVKGWYELDTSTMQDGVYDYTYTITQQDGTTHDVMGKLEIGVNGSARIIEQKLKVTTYSGTPEYDGFVKAEVSYNAFGEVIRQSNANNELTEFGYDDMGHIISEKQPGANGVARAVFYDNYGNEKSYNPETTYYYDNAGRQIATQDAASNYYADNGATPYYWLTAYNNAGLEIGRSTPEGGEVLLGYDEFGNMVRQRTLVDVVNQTQVFREVTTTYNDLNQAVRTNLPFDAAFKNTQGITTLDGLAATLTSITTRYEEYAYDFAGRRIMTRNALGQQAISAYDAMGQLLYQSGFDRIATHYRHSSYAPDSAYTTTTVFANGRSLIDTYNAFGQLETHVDQEGRSFGYAYNKAGWLVSQASKWGAIEPDYDPANPDATLDGKFDTNPQYQFGQSISNEYYQSGLVKSITNLGQITEYTYDAEGRRTSELFRHDTPDNLIVYQDMEASYDSLGRLVRITDYAAPVGNDIGYIQYRYDANGNRRHVQALVPNIQTGATTASETLDYWYDYDRDNRFIVTKGSRNDSTGKIKAGANGYALSYYLSNERKTQTYRNSGQSVTESYFLNAAGLLSQTKIQQGTTTYFIDNQDYDAVGNLVKSQESKSVNGGAADWTQKSLNLYASSRLESNRVSINKYIDKVTDTSRYFDADGNLLKTLQKTNGSADISSYYFYQYWDTAKQWQIRIEGNPSQLGYKPDGKWAPGQSLFEYDANGHLTSVVDVEYRKESGQKVGRRLDYTLDQDGRILRRKETVGNTNNGGIFSLVDVAEKNRHNYAYFNGLGVGDYGTGGPAGSTVDYITSLKQAEADLKNKDGYRPVAVTSRDYDYNFQPINTMPGQVSTYVVQASTETLEQIASVIWGDSSFWYVLAEANGYTSKAATLYEGQVLSVPGVNTNTHNNVDTFKPYNPAELLGNIQPTLPEPPEPRKEKGSSWAEIIVAIIVVIVMVVVTVVTEGATAKLLGDSLAWLAVVIGGAVGAAAGAAAGQVAGNLLGIRDGYSWSEIRDAAIVGGVAAGFSEIANFGNWLEFLGDGFIHSFAEAAISTTATNATLSLAGKGSFQWRDSLAAGVTAGVSKSMNGSSATPAAGAEDADFKGWDEHFVEQFPQQFSSAFVNEGVRALVYSDDFDFVGVATQSIGKAAGGAMLSAGNGAESHGAAEEEEEEATDEVEAFDDNKKMSEKAWLKLQYGDEAEAMMARTESQRVDGAEAALWFDDGDMTAEELALTDRTQGETVREGRFATPNEIRELRGRIDAGTANMGEKKYYQESLASLDTPAGNKLKEVLARNPDVLGVNPTGDFSNAAFESMSPMQLSYSSEETGAMPDLNGKDMVADLWNAGNDIGGEANFKSLDTYLQREPEFSLLMAGGGGNVSQSTQANSLSSGVSVANGVVGNVTYVDGYPVAPNAHLKMENGGAVGRTDIPGTHQCVDLLKNYGSGRSPNWVYGEEVTADTAKHLPQNTFIATGTMGADGQRHYDGGHAALFDKEAGGYTNGRLFVTHQYARGEIPNVVHRTYLHGPNMPKYYVVYPPSH